MKKVKLIFIILFLLLHLGLILTLKYEEELTFQNRSSYKFPKFSWNSILSGKYQKKMELAFNDQIYQSDKLKQLKTGLDSIIYKNISQYTIPKNSYNLAVGQHFFYQDGDYIVDWPRSKQWLKDTKKQTKEIADSYNKVSGVKKYLYYVNTSDSINFDTNKNNLYRDVVKKYNTYKIDSFKINNYEDYKKNFYKSDYHWNNLGSYIGYQDIIHLMKGNKEQVLIPEDEMIISNNFYGNRAEYNQYFYVKDQFKVYSFKYNEYTKYVDGYKTTLEPMDTYTKREKYTDYYSKMYGYIDKELRYDFHQPDKENLLILTNSFGYPIIKMIASHYNNTYAIDLRKNINFNINKYIKENQIDSLLVITSGVYYKDSRFKLKGV